VREVAEETGLVCDLGPELPSTTYLDAKGRLKLVRYWSMRVVAVEPWQANDEIDDRRWATLDDALGRLTYPHDRLLLERLRGQLR
jgi:8-oxo-dGTP diphosphatase